ncbi:DNA polymerase I [Sulfurovum lithotrophicum]|uniref:DNA polymerase I n=1 Tax=Sulfurovum lithotrophicum TaxID=206403 RepID=A0A7U4M1E7_9BACT|nr:DNA polymerase I [Sulfurovum lithotrophicum]AKF25098.1 DNA polymerase I [Sulfurovum lithotrophicum]
MKTITIIDTFGFFFRSYYALPPLRNSEGFPTGLLTGFINLVDSLHRDHGTDYLVFALDSKGPTFRNEIYPEYKANREAPPEDLTKQLPIAIRWVEKMGFANLAKEGFEADDIITTVTKFAREQDMKVKVVSHDKDLYQLIDDGLVVMYDSIKRKEIDEAACIEKFGVNPKDFVDFQAIVGDASDNVPGVKGIGVKGAAKLINEFHTLENIYANIEKCGTPRIQKLLLEYKESAFLSRELVKMRDDVYDDLDLSKFVFEERNYLSCLIDEFEKYEMKRALQKAKVRENEAGCHDITPPKPKTPLLTFESITLDTKEKLNEVIDELSKDILVAFDTETTGLDTRTDKMVGFSFCTSNEKAYYVPVGHSYLGVEEQVDPEDAVFALQKLMKHKIVGQNLKFDLSLLYNQYGMEEVLPFADTMIMAWLTDPGSRVGLDSLAQKFFKYDMKPFKEMVKKGENFSHVNIADATFYAAEDAWMTFLLYGAIKKKMELSSLTHLLKEAKDVEYPFINVLIRMERLGIKVDQAKLETLKKTLSEDLHRLTSEIHELSGSEFNIRSTQQLGVVLFQQLGLKGGKKTKTGYSTNEAVLQSLKHEHPVIGKILEYREYHKMLSTYVEPLLKLAKKDEKSRIYTSFIQTGTATGRLSSKDPNLQNIPVRSALGRSVREAFVAKEGYKLVSIDYSQIELRLLAHFSKDAALMEAFNKGTDIHMATAIKLFGEDEAKAKRNFAKSVNFGLLYGMGPKKLSDELGITSAEAKEIIANYFASFPTVKNFLEGIQERVKIDGYVETLLRRRRIFDYENANGMQKAAYMRESVNTVFQGSAADLIKLSMNDIDSMIIDEALEAHMLLQIHDELIFEIKEDQVEKISKRFVHVMEHIWELEVPLVCSVSVGDSWGELK